MAAFLKNLDALERDKATEAALDESRCGWIGTKELPEAATAKDFLAVRTEGWRQVKRQLRHYNLDAIISVGYRVNSRRAVGFRQWATRTLSEHLTHGYTLNRQRLQANALELEAALQLVKKAAQSPELLADTGRGLVDIVTRYAGDFFRRFAGASISIQIDHSGPTASAARSSWHRAS